MNQLQLINDHYMVDNEDLGQSVDLLVLAVRPKAIAPDSKNSQPIAKRCNLPIVVDVQKAINQLLSEGRLPFQFSHN